MCMTGIYAAAIVFNKVYTKILVTRADPIALAFWVNCFSALIMLPFVGFIPLLTLSPSQWFLIFIGGIGWAISGVISNISSLKADLSLREPVLALRVPIISLASVVLLHESITFVQILATLCIMIGIIVVSYERTLWSHDRATMHWLGLSIAVTAIVVVIDKIASLSVPGFIYVFFMFLIPAMLQGIWYHKNLITHASVITKEFSGIATISLALVVCYWTYIELLNRLPLSFIYPMMQACSIFVVLYGVYV